MKWNSNLYDQSHGFVSQYGKGLLELLNPIKGERILDLGCGTGDLTNEIYKSGVETIGIDSSPEMISAASSKFPSIPFYIMDAKTFNFDTPFDAIFSNAVLHWVTEKEKAIQHMYASLKYGGRIVVEFGGKGNNHFMLQALRETLLTKGHTENAKINYWYYPSIGEYAIELEKVKFRVTYAVHYDRKTELSGDEGMKNWFRMFAGPFFVNISPEEKEVILDEVNEKLKASHYQEGKWYADYKRIRVIAVKE